MIEAFLGMNDLLLRTLGLLTLIGLGVLLWMLLQRGEFTYHCPRCRHRMPKTSSTCRRCGWSSGVTSETTRRPWS